MKFIAIKYKNNIIDFFRISFLVLFSFLVCYYYGFNGIVPLDDFVNFNSGYRILKGDLPFRDYYEVTGPVLSIFQSVLFYLFGVSWKTFVLHSSLINSFSSLIIYLFFLNQTRNKNLSLLIAISFSILFYPNNGVPGVDHHAWSFAIVSLLFFNMGLEKKNFLYIFISILTFFLSFLTKQVPAVYILLIIIMLYFIEIINEKKIIYFFKIILSILVLFISLIFFFKKNEINLDLFFEQYFLMLFNFGTERISKINIYLIKESLSKIYFLIFLIIPSLIIFYKKKELRLYEKKIFLIIFLLISTALFYEIHTNNQAMTFALTPVICGFLYEIQKNNNKDKVLKYIYIILILLCCLKIIQFQFTLIFILLPFFSICIFYIKKYKRINININFLLIVYIFLTSFYYYVHNVHQRMYKDIVSENNLISFDGSKINKSFENLNWKMNSKDSVVNFIDDKKSTINLLNQIKKNYIIISDYQIYNLILDKKDYSPVKYWATEISYPSKHNKLRKKFEKYFLEKIIKNKIEYIILDKNTSLFKENLLDYNFLSKCLEKKTVNENLRLEIFKFKFNCFQKLDY